MGDPKDETKPVGITPPETDKFKEATVDGYTFKFDGEIIDDVDVMEMAGDIEKGEVKNISKLVKLVLGDDGYNDMRNYFVTKDGKLKFTTLSNVFEAIFTAFDPKG